MARFYLIIKKCVFYVLGFVSFACSCLVSFSQPVIAFSQVVSGLSAPVDIVNAGDGTNRLFIAQLGGTIKVYSQSHHFLGDFLTVSGISTGGERGLLSIAFHPDYETNGFFFVYYTNTNGDIEVARYQVSSSNPNLANAASKVIVITIPHPTYTNHNGGKLNFGSDGYLYFATGDGGSGGDPFNNAQNGNSLLGKMLRIAVTTSANPPYYTIPADNPFINDPNIRDEVWALGLRNPFRWSFDRQTQDMWIGDVGQEAWEEINYRSAGTTKGINYGWRCYEGNAVYNPAGCGAVQNYIFPVYQYANPSPGSTSVTGGYVYRGLAYPGFRGYYIASDFYFANAYLIKYSNSLSAWRTTVQNGLPGNVVGFGESENGELYAVSINGFIYRLAVIGYPELQITSFAGLYDGNGAVRLNWTTGQEVNIERFDVEYSTDALSFDSVGSATAANDPGGSAYQFNHSVVYDGALYYRLKIADLNGRIRHSDTIALNIDLPTENFVVPSVISNGILIMYIKNSYTNLEIVSMNGSIVHKQTLSGRTGRFDIPVHSLAAGIYIVRLSNNNKSILQKIFIRQQ